MTVRPTAPWSETTTMRRALILGANGQIGRATALSLHRDGWDVDLADRGGRALPPELVALGLRRHVVDRSSDADLDEALADGVDLLVDIVAYTAEDGDQLVARADRIGHLVAISSVSVYADETGAAFDGEDTFPQLPVPILESQPTVAPGPSTYSTRKVALERALLQQDRLPVTVLRPGAIHGPGQRHAREWWVVKRALDGRCRLPLAHPDGRFHTTSVANLAELIRLAGSEPGHRVLNACDPKALSAAEIVAAVVAAGGWDLQVCAISGPPPAGVGDSPWSVPADVVVDMSAARDQLGYRALVDYPQAVIDTVRWLVQDVGPRPDWQVVLSGLAGYGAAFMDYAAEDAYLASVN